MTLPEADQLCRDFCIRNPAHPLAEAIITVRYFRDKDLAELGRLRVLTEKLDAHVKALQRARAQQAFDID